LDVLHDFSTFVVFFPSIKYKIFENLILFFYATILFDSFTYIYLVFFLCFIYKMSWYSLFYVLKALLDVRLKKNELEIIDGFDLQSMFCVELKLWRSKWSASSGIKKITFIPFYTYMERKIERERAWKL
jgi:hypothetical protein